VTDNIDTQMIESPALVKNRRIFGDIFHLALDTFRTNRARFLLTSLGTIMGTVSLIWVVTISLTGEKYVLAYIQNIGSNLIWIEYSGLADPEVGAKNDFLTIDDMEAVERQVPGIVAATPVANLHLPYSTAGTEITLLILGVDPQYEQIRRLRLLSGRFLDDQDARLVSKAAVVTERFAISQFGSVDDALGKSISLSGIPFQIIGTFTEGTNTYGQSEIVDNTILIPYKRAHYLTGSDAINQIYLSASDMSSVPEVSREISRIIRSRHRPEAVYDVGNLTQVLSVARTMVNVLSLLLVLFSLVTLLVGGMGIMNIMLATVNSRTLEIGIRKALGATSGQIRLQFLMESTMISMGGGIVGTILGFALPLSIAKYSNLQLQTSWISAVVALLASATIGIAFGTVPAARAARFDPVESLKAE
jgi:putative ABC transport system permease protein